MLIGILYNTITNVLKGKDVEKIADNEVLETVAAVKKALIKKGHEAVVVKLDLENIESLKKFDAIFNLAESVDGDTSAEIHIVKALEKLGIPFTGNKAYTTEICLDKDKTKKILIENNILTPKYQICSTGEENINLTFPLIVKPLHEDASIGIEMDCFVKNKEELKLKVMHLITNYKQPALVEEYIEGQEINAALLGNRNPVVLPLSEIIFSYPPGVPKFLTFEAKWIEDSMLYKNSKGKCPADVDNETKNKIIEISKKCFDLMKCTGYARVDFRIRDGIPFVLEINPNPCINPVGTGYVRSANATGMSYEDMVEEILMLAFNK